MDNRVKLHPAVFYRKYDDKTILYNTEQQKVYTFNPISGDVFDCFKSFCYVTEAVQSLSKEYEFDDFDDFNSSVNEFVDEMLEKGILQEEYKQKEHYKTLEKEIGQTFSDRKQLYSVLFEVTYKCNEKCRHCYVVDEHRKELSTSEIESIIDDLAVMNVLNLVFTGGEVFSRKDAFEILEYAYHKGFVIDIFTNGNLLDGNDYIRLKLLYPRSVHFSIYSHIPEKHDNITRIKGSFEKTINAIKSCVVMGIPVNIKTPVFDETFNDISGIVALAEELGVSIEIGSNITPKKDGNLNPTHMEINSEEKEQILRERIQALIPSYDIEAEENNAQDNLRICGAGDKSISINPYGEVFPCNMLQLCIGDLKMEPIKDIWEKSETLKWWRENNLRKNRKGCEKCEYSKKCVFCPGEAMMRTGNPLSKYDKACRDTYASIGRENKKGGKIDEEV